MKFVCRNNQFFTRSIQCPPVPAATLHGRYSLALAATGSNPSRTPRTRIPLTQQASALSSTLARRRVEQQEGIVNAADLQRQEEDDWLLSMQAEADAEAQTSSQTRPQATTRRRSSKSAPGKVRAPQPQLGNTPLGRNMLQRKVDNFAEMVALVTPPQQQPSADNQAFQKVQAPNPTQSAPYATHRPPLQGSQNTPTSRHGQYAGHQGIAGDISTSAAEQRIPTGIVYSPPEVATALSDPHLRRLHDAAATWKRSLKHQPHSLSTKPSQGPGDSEAPVEAQLDTLSAQSSKAVDSQARYDHPQQSAAINSGAGFRHPMSNSHSGIEQRQAPAARQPQTSALTASFSSISSTDSGSTYDTADIGEYAAASTPVGWQDDFAPGGATSESIQPDARIQQLATIPPPPPPRPPQLPKASWWAAIKGEAPPWLL